jgi:hypothetical protein
MFALSEESETAAGHSLMLSSTPRLRASPLYLHPQPVSFHGFHGPLKEVRRSAFRHQFEANLFVRTSGVVVKIELVQRDGNRRLSQQVAQLEDGPGVLGIFVSVA